MAKPKRKSIEPPPVDQHVKSSRTALAEALLSGARRTSAANGMLG
jgi:hypothetical protein